MPYNIDPVVEEIRETRKKLYERCGRDPHKYGKLMAAAAAQRKARFAGKKKTEST